MPFEAQKVPTFSLLPDARGRRSAYLESAVINVIVFGLFVVFSWSAWNKTKVILEHEQLSVVIPVEQPRPRRVIPRVHISPSRTPQLRILTPQIVFPRRDVETTPQVVQLKGNAPSAPPLPSYRPVTTVQSPRPRVGLFQTQRPAKAVTQKDTTTKTGGFGDPAGVRPRPNSSGSQVAAYGSFQNSVGVDSGAGPAHKGSIHSTAFASRNANDLPQTARNGRVSAAGFGNNAIGGPAPSHAGHIQQGAFRNNVVAQNAVPRAAKTGTDFEQVRILFHPRPKYTAEARQLGIQGEVVLEVLFSADGSVHVLRVVHGLGHGLDEQAIRAAQQTRFQPALKDGRPVDMTTYYRITFQLA